MAWPAVRTRTGGSRREARSRLFAAALSGVAVILGASLLIVSRVSPDRVRGLRTAALDVTAPVWSATHGPVQAIFRMADGVADYWNAVDRARTAETALVTARRDASQAPLLAAENQRLKRLLRFVETDSRRIVVARVAGGSGASLVESAVIGAGSIAGVRAGQPVATDAGLLGRVTEVGARAARVLLVSDVESRVPVRVVRTNVTALLTGVGGGMAELRFVGGEPESAPRVGDLLVTSGEGGVFAPDVPVARVEGVAGETVRARPLAKPDTLGLAVIEAAWLPPPKTDPAATASVGVPIRMAAMVNP